MSSVALHRLTVTTRSAGSQCLVLPSVDGLSLVDLLTDFERARSYEPVGGYGPAVRRDLRQAHLALWPRLTTHGVTLLDCTCGEPGCWPVTASILVGDERVCWSTFTQPHRPERDYGDLGLICFDRAAYVAALPAWDCPACEDLLTPEPVGGPANLRHLLAQIGSWVAAGILSVEPDSDPLDRMPPEPGGTAAYALRCTSCGQRFTMVAQAAERAWRGEWRPVLAAPVE